MATSLHAYTSCDIEKGVYQVAIHHNSQVHSCTEDSRSLETERTILNVTTSSCIRSDCTRTSSLGFWPAGRGCAPDGRDLLVDFGRFLLRTGRAHTGRLPISAPPRPSKKGEPKKSFFQPTGTWEFYGLCGATNNYRWAAQLGRNGHFRPNYLLQPPSWLGKGKLQTVQNRRLLSNIYQWSMKTRKQNVR